MNILVVSSFLPYPIFSGGHVRLYNILMELAKKHTITLVCEKRDYQIQEDIDELKKFCKEIKTFARKKQWSLSTILKTGFSRYPFLMVGHTNPAMRKEIARMMKKEKFDLIHVETFYVMQNIPQTSIPIVLVEHNIEYLVYRRYMHEAPYLIRPLLFLDIAKMKFWEQKFWQKAKRLVAVSEEEKQEMKRSDVVVVPNGVDIEKFKIQNPKLKMNKKEKTILFIGDFRWMQNRDALEWILKEIWPKIKFKIQYLKFKVRLWIVGKEIPSKIKGLTKDMDIIFDENAPKDTVEIFRKADLLLAPIRVGGGTSYKILEAIASGVPVVTNFRGIAGLDVEKDTDVLVAENAEELADNTYLALTNSELAQSIIQNALRKVEKIYNWERIAKILESVYISAMQ